MIARARVLLPPRTAVDARALAPAAVLALAVVYAVAFLADGEDVAVLVPLLAVVVVAVLAHPAVGMYLVFGAAILLEQFVILGLSPITVGTHFYQNLSAYTAIPLRLSAADLLLLLTLAAWGARLASGRAARPAPGPFGWPIAGYIAIFVLGLAIGAMRGGWDLDAAFAELRGPAQLCLAYVLTANCVRGRSGVRVVVWIFVLAVGVKAIQGVVNALQAAALPYDLEAVTAHEDVVFFDAALALALAAVVLRLRSRLTVALLALAPVVLAAELLTERRVGFIALGVACVVVLVVTARREPRRAAAVAACGALAASAYVGVFWDAQGAIAEPIRAVRSIADPSYVSVRDEMSDDWRVREDRNIAYTIQQLPITGVGLGQEYLVQVTPPPLPPTFTYWRYITHNALLWLWLKAGPIGAFALWALVARVVLLGSALSSRAADVELRWLALLPVCLIAVQVVFSAVELGLTYSRTMIVLGTVLGLAAPLARCARPWPSRAR